MTFSPVGVRNEPQRFGMRVMLGFLRHANLRTTLRFVEVRMKPDLVERDPEIMSGALCFTGTRVPVQNLFDYLEGSSSLEEFLEDFLSVRRETAVAVLEAAKNRLFADAAAA